MTRKVRGGVAFLVGVLSVLTGGAAAQAPIQAPRLYVLDCGSILNRDPGRYSLRKEEVPSLTMAAPCFLVVHPKGTLLYDLGLEMVPTIRISLLTTCLARGRFARSSLRSATHPRRSRSS